MIKCVKFWFFESGEVLHYVFPHGSFEVIVLYASNWFVHSTEVLTYGELGAMTKQISEIGASKDGLYVLRTIPHGYTGQEQKVHLKEKGCHITSWGSRTLTHQDFTISPKGVELLIGILTYEQFKKHSSFVNLPWTPNNAWRLINQVYNISNRPPHDIGVFPWEHLTLALLEDMGLLRISPLSNPIKDSFSGEHLGVLGLDCHDGFIKLTGHYVFPKREHKSEIAFSFVL